MSPSIFINSQSRLPLVTESGKKFSGLENSKSPELCQRVSTFFEYLNRQIGFPETDLGRENQVIFNLLLQSAYPEIMIDLADLIYVQHERPAVYLNFDHIHMNLKKDRVALSESMDQINEKFSILFRELAKVIRENPLLFSDSRMVRLLSESYSIYLFQTENFPWDNPMEMIPSDLKNPIMDIATGLAGFRLIHDWPENYPKLILTDNLPFIIMGLTHYAKLSGKTNVEILNVDFPDGPMGKRCGCILANKFLHHLQRGERKKFLQWAIGALDAGGLLLILDTDLECQILRRAQNQEYQDKLIRGYKETLVSIEENFCETLIQDVRHVGFDVSHFDFHEYQDETDAYSQYPGDNLSIKFIGLEIMASKV
ncbi:MAG: hypothetical protein HOK41_10155 [Nitrospina sp.]|jgi:hypothetical protein|nr:hypothetical protein [Nitrospina sp.]MBT6718608.1 hypothetical protein [Nitrospina sp.]